MKTMLRNILLLAVLAIGGLTAGTTRAANLEIRDEAGLFSASAIRQANETIRTIHKDFGKDLIIETFAAVPEGRKAEYERNREEFFGSFLRERAQAARVNGVYLMVVKEPAPHNLRVQAGVGQTTRQRAFLTSDRDQLVKVLLTSFRAKQYDAGLLEGTRFVERTMRSHLGNQTRGFAQTSNSVTTQRSSGTSAFMVALLVVGGIFLLVALMRMFGGNRSGVGSGLGSGGVGGGGGFLTGLLGGIGGAIAGSWLYDRFFSSHSHADDGFGASSSDSRDSDVGGDYSSSGGDIDSGSGGDSSDFGGGDFGGGGDA